LNATTCAAEVRHVTVDTTAPTPLYQDTDHEIFWLGIADESSFRCNVYLLRDGDQALLVDPGSRPFYRQVCERVAQIMAPEAITGVIACHQDPDVAASLVDWLEVVPSLRVYTTPRTDVLLPHHGTGPYEVWDVAAEPVLTLPSGAHLRFIEAPFMHSPGAFATYDDKSGFLFSGDIWAALDLDWKLFVESFSSHRSKLDLFHIDYMASNVAARGFVNRLADIDIRAILPQHGSIIGAEHVADALEYLRTLRCGLDIVYADLDP
jgi:flavorubredoxin